eukprot:scaffold122395_cov14-Tisochrysis_lutea.AAC.1
MSEPATTLGWELHVMRKDIRTLCYTMCAPANVGTCEPTQFETSKICRAQVSLRGQPNLSQALQPLPEALKTTYASCTTSSMPNQYIPLEKAPWMLSKNHVGS